MSFGSPQQPFTGSSLSATYLPPPPPEEFTYDTQGDYWERNWEGCKDAQGEWDGVRDYTALLTPQFGLIRRLVGWAWASLTPANDPQRANEIIEWDDDYLDGAILPDMRVLNFTPMRRHAWYIEQDNEPSSEETPIPAIMQAAAMMASDTEL